MKRNQNTSGCALNAAQSLAQTERINAIVVRNVQRPITAENLTVKGGRSFVQCPKCNCADLKTVDSRPGDGMTRRRKECQGCGGRFTTYEITEKEYNRLKRLVAVANDPWYKEIFGGI